MDHRIEISRANPTCFLFLVDQSGSMEEHWGVDFGKTKAQGVADALNRLLQTLVIRCTEGNSILDRYQVGVIGYFGDELGLGFQGNLAGEVVRKVSEIGYNPLRIEDRVKKVPDGAGGLVDQLIRFPVWFDPFAQGRTPMCKALEVARDVIQDFVNQYPRCYPPIVINISDGKANDAHPEPPAMALRSVASQNGNVLLFNIHISARNDAPFLFPASDAGLPDEWARLLFRMSSPLPPDILKQARIEEASIPEGARGFAFNADLVALIKFLKVGTEPNPTLLP